MSIEADQAASATSAAAPSDQDDGVPKTGGHDALDQPVSPPPAPRRAGGGARLPVILPKSRPPRRSKGATSKTSSIAHPSGSAILEPANLEEVEAIEPEDIALLDRPAFKPVPQKADSSDEELSQSATTPDAQPDPAKPDPNPVTKAAAAESESSAGETSSAASEPTESKTEPKASDKVPTAQSAEDPPVRGNGEADQPAPGAAPELVSFAPSAIRPSPDGQPNPVQLGPAADIWAGALNAAAAAPTDADVDFKALVVDGVSAGQDDGPRFVGAKESGTTMVGGRRRAGGKPMLAPPVEANAAVGGAPVPVGGGAGPVTVPAPKAPRPPRTAGPGQTPAAQTGVPRRVKLQVARISPWSLTKMSFLLSVALGIAFVVMTFVVWNVANNAHLFTNINDKIVELAGPANAAKFNILNYVAQGKVMAGATVIAVVNTVLATVLATLGALIYNITAVLVGGVHVILKDD